MMLFIGIAIGLFLGWLLIPAPAGVVRWWARQLGKEPPPPA